MTNQPAANEPTADPPAARDTATDNAPDTTPDTVTDATPDTVTDAPDAQDAPDAPDAQDAADGPQPEEVEQEPGLQSEEVEPTFLDAHTKRARIQPEPEPTRVEEPPMPPPPPPGSMPPPAGFGPPPPFGAGGPPPPFGAGGPPPPFGAGGPPPPFGAGGPPPGPTFNRQNLIRPVNGRYIAGVCAAVGRATNTDPALWRVLFAVLTLAGGVGLLGYLVGWLLIPGEGDTASPLESMLGRGRSSTSGPLVIVVGVLAVLTLLFVVSDNATAAMVGVGVVVGTVALLVRGNQGRQQTAQGAPPGYAYQGQPDPAQPYQQPGQPAGATMTMPNAPEAPPAPAAPFESPEPPPISEPATLNLPPTGQAPPVVSPPFPPLPPMPPIPPMPGGYRPPFAPHGPYASSSPYAASLGYPTSGGQTGPRGPLPPYPGLQPVPRRPPKPPRPKSKLGRLTLSVLCLALGVVVVTDLGAHVAVDPQVYVATALGVLALGLIVGARFGRARWLIPFGVILTIALPGTTAAQHVTTNRSVDNIDVTPTSVAEIEPSYHTDFGNIRLDLSKVDFTGESVDVNVDVGVGGNINITLPPNVDADVAVDVQGGDVQLFDHHFSGLNQHQERTDLGDDGSGGGQIHITANVNWGNVEVQR